jgi:hypothetical protein
MKQKNRIQSGMRFFRYSHPPYFCSPNGEIPKKEIPNSKRGNSKPAYRQTGSKILRYLLYKNWNLEFEILGFSEL